MGSSLDSRDDRHAYIGYIFEELNAFVVNLAPNARIGDVAEGREIDFGNELPACSRQNHNLVLSILGDPVKGFDKLRMILCGESERPTLGVKFDNQHTVSIPRQLQASISSKIVIFMSHRVPSLCCPDCVPHTQVATMRPPAARITSPVIQPDSSDARNTASGAMSVTRPSRPSGVFPARTAPAPPSKVPAATLPSVSV